MQHGLHFISGLPRSGSTLLSALLRQNPRISASMSSPMASIVSALMAATSQKNEFAVFLNEATRKRLLHGAFDAYYADTPPDQLVFDTNRHWTGKLPALADLFPKARIVCCVRNPAWVLDSFEGVLRRNPYQLSGIFGFDPGSDVYSRVEAMTKGGGVVGSAINALREAIYGPLADRVILIRFETLVSKPLDALKRLYDALGEPWYPHDPERIEPTTEMQAFDARIGTPGLHSVGGTVRHAPRRPTIPPDLFGHHTRGAFWEDPKQLPPGLLVI